MKEFLNIVTGFHTAHRTRRFTFLLNSSTKNYALNIVTGFITAHLFRIDAIKIYGAAPVPLDLLIYTFLARFSRRSYIAIDLFSLVLRLEAGTSHGIDALCVEWVLDAKVVLSNLFSFREELYGSVETTELFVLFADAQLRHYHDCNEVIELKV